MSAHHEVLRSPIDGLKLTRANAWTDQLVGGKCPAVNNKVGPMRAEKSPQSYGERWAVYRRRNWKKIHRA